MGSPFDLGYAVSMVFIFLFSILAVVAWALAATIHDEERRIPGLCSLYNAVAQVAILFLGATDWAYSIVETTPYQLLAFGHLEMLAIFGPALILAFLIPMRPRKRTAEALLIHSFQAVAFIPVLLHLEYKTGLSFLSWNTCIALILSSSSVLLSLSPMLAYGATFGGKFHEIAYKDRAELVSYIEKARKNLRNLEWTPPITFLDSGRIVGDELNRRISIHTRFSFLPFGYELDFAVNFDSAQARWMLGPGAPTKLFPEASQWTRTLLAQDESKTSQLHSPEETSLPENLLSCLSEVREKLSAYMKKGYLVCTGENLSFRCISAVGIQFGTEEVEALIQVAKAIESLGDEREELKKE